MFKFFLFDQLKRNLKQRFKSTLSVAAMHVPGRTRLLLRSSNKARTLQGLGRRPSGQQAATRSSDRNPGRVGETGGKRAPAIERVAHGFSFSVLAFEPAG